MKFIAVLGLAVAGALSLLLPFAASAQVDAPATTIVAPTSFLYDAWTIIQPIVTVLAGTVGPIAVAWITARVMALLKISNENAAQALEAQLREALHLSAMNALKYAASKYGLGLSGTAIELTGKAVLDSKVLTEALKYIRGKNPDAVDAFALDDKALTEIILSKVPDVKAIIAAGEPSDQQKAAAR